MINIKNFGIVSLALIGLYNAPVIAKELPDDLTSPMVIVSKGIMTAHGEIIHASDKDTLFQQHCLAQDQASANQDAYNNSWLKYAKDTSFFGTKYTGEKLLDTASYAARYLAAWNLNYYGIEAIEETIAYSAWGMGTLSAGPAAGSGAYYATKGALKVARYVIPGYEGYLAGLCAPITQKVTIDPIIYYGPSVAKSMASAGVTGTKAIANGFGSLYSYWRG